MTYRIQTKRSNVADLTPHFTELLPGELALNYSDMILYALDDGGNVRQITSGGGGGDLVAMNYTFWVKVVQEGESLTRFEGTGDNGTDFDVNIEGFDVALNGVSLVPNTDYTIDEFALILDEPATVGDVVIVRSLEPTDGVASSQLTTNDIALLGEDTQTPAGQAYKEWTERNNLQTQQDANWHLLHTIEDLHIPDEFNPEGLVTEEELSDIVEDQKQVDEEQDREIEQIEARVSQIESVSLDAKYLYEADAKIPRDGEFTCLKNNGTEITNEWADTQMLYFAENAVEGKPDWDHVTENDVIRIGGSSVGIILPTAVQSREADTFAEFKVIGMPSDRLFEVELIRGSSQPMAGVEYGVLLLSSFDPSGLATNDYVNEQLAKKYDKSGGEITGTVNVTGGTLKITKNELKIEKNDGTNAFRVQPETQVTFNVPTRMNEPLDMKDNKIIGCGPADPERGHDVVNVDFLNEALGTIETNVGDAVLSANQDWSGINKFKGVTHFESAMVTRAGTWLELQGDAEDVQNRYFKIRANADLRFYSYPGQNNTGARNCFSILHEPGESYPVVTLNYLPDPTSNGNPVNLRYANNTYLKQEDYVAPQALTPVVFKTDQYVRAYAGKGPPAGYASFINAPEPGGQSNSNTFFGNCNYGIQVAYDKLKNAQGEEFASGESYNVSGYVSVIGKEDHKLYFKAPVVRVHRQSGQNYISITFPGDKGWLPAATFGTGSTSDQNYFSVIVEAYTNG